MIKKIFGKKTTPPPPPQISNADVERLDHSFNLLRTTTSAVTEAATETARMLQDQLRDTEFRFFSTIDAIEDFVIIKDGSGRWKTVNRSGQNLFKWIHGEYFDKTDLELANTHPLYTECLSQCSESDERAWLSKKTHRSRECIPYGLDGHRCFDIMKTPVFDECGNRKELIVIGRDITEEIEKQRRMNAAFVALNSASDNIIILDFRGNVYFCNDIFLQTFKINSYDEIVGHHITTILHIDDFDNLWKAVTENHHWDGVCMPNGDICELRHNLHITPMMNGLPYPIYYVCTLKLNHV